MKMRCSQQVWPLVVFTQTFLSATVYCFLALCTSTRDSTLNYLQPFIVYIRRICAGFASSELNYRRTNVFNSGVFTTLVSQYVYGDHFSSLYPSSVSPISSEEEGILSSDHFAKKLELPIRSIETVSISDGKMEDIKQAVRYTLIGWVPDGITVTMYDLQTMYTNIWKPESLKVDGMRLVEGAPDRFILKFEEAKDMHALLFSQPWTYKGHICFLQHWDWDSSTPAHLVPFKFGIFWVQALNLHWMYHDPDILESIFSKAGRVLEIDECPSSMDVEAQFSPAARIVLPLTQDLVSSVRFEAANQVTVVNLAYEFLPSIICSFCIRIGHKVHHCPYKANPEIMTFVSAIRDNGSDQSHLPKQALTPKRKGLLRDVIRFYREQFLGTVKENNALSTPTSLKREKAIIQSFFTLAQAFNVTIPQHLSTKDCSPLSLIIPSTPKAEVPSDESMQFTIEQLNPSVPLSELSLDYSPTSQADFPAIRNNFSTYCVTSSSPPSSPTNAESTLSTTVPLGLGYQALLGAFPLQEHHQQSTDKGKAPMKETPIVPSILPSKSIEEISGKSPQTLAGTHPQVYTGRVSYQKHAAGNTLAATNSEAHKNDKDSTFSEPVLEGDHNSCGTLINILYSLKFLPRTSCKRKKSTRIPQDYNYQSPKRPKNKDS